MINQDIVAWVGQGRIADRTRENLGASDRGVLLLRRRLFDDLAAIAAGRDPSGTIRDAAANSGIALPVAARRLLTDGLTQSEYAAHPILGRHLDDFVFHYGQPASVRAAYRDAMGLRADATGRVAFA